MRRRSTVLGPRRRPGTVASSGIGVKDGDAAVLAAGCLAGFLVGQEAARRMGAMARSCSPVPPRRFGAAPARVPKFGLRALARAMAREVGPRGIHVGHVIIDRQIRFERYAHLEAERGQGALLEPEAIAAMYAQLHAQRSA